MIQPGPVLLRRFVRNKNGPLVEEVELLEANQSFAHVRFPSRRESSVCTSNPAPTPRKNVTEVSIETVPTPPTIQPASDFTSTTQPGTRFSTKFSR